MEWIKEQAVIDEIASCLGGRYAAVQYVAKIAHQLVIKYNHCILDSEAIAWLLTGDTPRPIILQKYKKPKRDWAISYADDKLSSILDVEVKNAVKHSIESSRLNKQLTFVYDDVQDIRQQRIRILTRILWIAIQEEE